MRGDLSAPVLAIIVTIGIIAAGLILLAWFWWFAPTAGKAGSLQILGTPAIVLTNDGGTPNNYTDDTWTLYIGVRNTGNDRITISAVTVKAMNCNLASGTNTINPGDAPTLVYTCTASQTSYIDPTKEYTVSGVISTNYGSYSFSAAVQK